jgi:hypothetical protein
MYTTKQYREAALKFRKRAEQAASSADREEFRSLQQSFDTLADNAEWLTRNGKNIPPPRESDCADADLTPNEERTLRCLGASLILQWNTIPAKLRRELFETAEDIGDLAMTSELRAHISRLFCTREDEEAGSDDRRSR